MKTGKLTYSGQAKSILENLKENTFDIENFEKWILENKFIVGGGYIIEYLEKLNKGEIANGLG